MDIPFHYAFKVKDLPSTRHFYGDVIGCVEGRSSQTWVDFDFFGHQISAHIDKQLKPLKRRDYIGKVDGIQVPIPHFGCVLTTPLFTQLHQRFVDAKVEFLIEPMHRYQGQVSQQFTMFVLDFSGNPLEFKCMNDAQALFS